MRTTDAYDVVEAAYDEGYGPDATRTVTHRRRVILLKQGSGPVGPCLLVIDRLTPADEISHTYQMLWHLNADTARTEGLAACTRDATEPNLTIVPAEVPGLTLDIVSGQEAPEWQRWKGIKDHQQGEYAPAPTAIYGVNATGPIRLVTLLYPQRAGEPCPVRAVVAAPDGQESRVRLLLTDGGHIDLREEDFPLA